MAQPFQTFGGRIWTESCQTSLEGGIETTLAEHCGNGLEEAVDLLSEARSDSQPAGKSLCTPLGTAALHVHFAITQKLLETRCRHDSQGGSRFCCKRDRAGGHDRHAGRAIGIRPREMASNPAAFAQISSESEGNLLKAHGAILDAAAFPSHDQAKLTAWCSRSRRMTLTIWLSGLPRRQPTRRTAPAFWMSSKT